MQAASELVQGGMITLFLDPAAKIGTILKNAMDWCRETGVENPIVAVANYMYPNCLVIGGSKEVSMKHSCGPPLTVLFISNASCVLPGTKIHRT